MPGVLKEGQAINTVIVARVLTIAVSVALAIGGTASVQQAEPPPFRAPDLEQDWIEKIDRLRYLIEEQLRQQRQQPLKDCDDNEISILRSLNPAHADRKSACAA
jgi:hypothetical protein